MFNLDWAADAAERAFKAMAQALIAVWMVGDGFDVFTADWPAAGGVALGAALLSILTSVLSAPVGDRGTASLVGTAPAGKHEAAPGPIENTIGG